MHTKRVGYSSVYGLKKKFRDSFFYYNFIFLISKCLLHIIKASLSLCSIFLGGLLSSSAKKYIFKSFYFSF